jgi:hypothetical protein
MDCNLHLEYVYRPAILRRWLADTDFRRIDPTVTTTLSYPTARHDKTFYLQPDPQDLELDEEMDMLLTAISNLHPLCVTRDVTVPNEYGEKEYADDYGDDDDDMPPIVEEVD